MSFEQFASMSKEYKLFGHKIRDKFKIKEDFIKTIDDLKGYWAKLSKLIIARLKKHGKLSEYFKRLLQKVDGFVINQERKYEETTYFYMYRFLNEESKLACEDAEVSKIVSHYGFLPLLDSFSFNAAALLCS